jgi:aspartyl-tRNA(Asn)/glutamyl-tRNA(Gln) amidotransferase subunit A
MGAAIPAIRYIQAQQTRRLLLRDFLNAFQRVDVIVSPTLPVPPPKIGEEVIKIKGVETDIAGALIPFTFPYNATGLPAISVPCGFSASGLPISLQIGGKPFDEETVLRVAHAYEQQAPWATKKISL